MSMAVTSRVVEEDENLYEQESKHKLQPVS